MKTGNNWEKVTRGRLFSCKETGLVEASKGMMRCAKSVMGAAWGQPVTGSPVLAHGSWSR